MPQDVLDAEIASPVEIKLGKKTYKLAFSMASVLAFKQKTGRNFFTPEGWEKFNLRDDPESVIAFFWAALQTFHPEVTFDQAARMADFGNMRRIADKCNEALSVHLPAPEPKAENEDPQPEPTPAQSIGSAIGQ
jgi:hypothetical protein